MQVAANQHPVRSCDKANGINNHGEIVGWSYTANNVNYQATVWTPVRGDVPEPSTWAMMLLGFAGLGFAFRRSPRRVRFAFAS
jgi:probable HAF family extracellular repeat protein